MAGVGKYFLENDSKDPVAVVNSLYDRVFYNDKGDAEDEKAIDQLLRIMRSQGYKYVSKQVNNSTYIQGDKSSVIEDIVQIGLLKIFQSMLVNFERKVEEPEKFYPFLKAFFRNAFYEYTERGRKQKENKENKNKRKKVRKRPFMVSIEAMQERSNADEHSSNDHTLKELSTIDDEPLNRMLSEEEEEVNIQMGDLLGEIMMNTTIIPHEMISFCYSVSLPRLLKTKLWDSLEFYEIVEKSTEAAMASQGIGKRVEVFTENIQRLSNGMGLPFPLQGVNYATLVMPVLKYMIENEAKRDREKATQLRELRDAVVDYYSGRVDLDRRSLVLTEAAKLFMGWQNIRWLSEKYEEAFNFNQTEEKAFAWGEKYLASLDEGYYKYNHEIENEGKLVYADYFSRPLDQKENMESGAYLSASIRKNTDRAMKKIKSDFMEAWHKMSNDSLRETFLGNYVMEKVKKAGRKNGGEQEER